MQGDNQAARSTAIDVHSQRNNDSVMVADVVKQIAEEKEFKDFIADQSRTHFFFSKSSPRDLMTQIERELGRIGGNTIKSDE